MAKRKGGRPSKWDELDIETKLPVLSQWAREGMLQKDMAARLGVSTDTFQKWLREKPVFYDAIKKNNEIANAEVENSMHREAVGYWIEEEALTNAGEVKKLRKWVRPHATAYIYWSKNRMPDRWRDQREVRVEQTEFKIDLPDELKLPESDGET